MASSTTSSTSRWESSTRPLVVRTVWVNGLRHAILTPSLAFARSGRAASGRRAEGGGRPSSPSSTSATSTASDESDRDAVPPGPPPPPEHQDLARCLVRWKLVVGHHGGGEGAGVLGEEDEGAEADAEEEGEDNDEARHVLASPRAPPLIGSYSSTFQHLCVATTLAPRAAERAADDDDDDALEGGADSQQANRRQLNGDVSCDLNPLSERVLQWLDLAGKATEGSSAVTKASRRNVSTAGSSRRLHSGGVVAPAPPARKFYPVASSQVSAPSAHGHERRLPLSAARRSISVDANLPPPPPRPAETRTSPPPPLIQTFQHVASTARTWHHGGLASQSRPQLHIFVPAVSDKGTLALSTTGELAELQEASDGESGISDA